jgi:hypothetical protein
MRKRPPAELASPRNGNGSGNGHAPAHVLAAVGSRAREIPLADDFKDF